LPNKSPQLIETAARRIVSAQLVGVSCRCTGWCDYLSPVFVFGII